MDAQLLGTKPFVQERVRNCGSKFRTNHLSLVFGPYFIRPGQFNFSVQLLKSRLSPDTVPKEFSKANILVK